MSKTDASIDQIEITLQSSKRRHIGGLLVSSDASLSKLHRIIQIARGW